MLVTKYYLQAAPDAGGVPHSATWAITHSWQNHGWLIRLSGWQEHKMLVYFILYFMLELLVFFFFPLTKVWSSGLERNSSQNLRRRNKYLSRQAFRYCWTSQSGSWPRMCSGLRQTWRCCWYAESRPPSRSVWGGRFQRHSWSTSTSNSSVLMNLLWVSVKTAKKCHNCCSKEGYLAKVEGIERPHSAAESSRRTQMQFEGNLYLRPYRPATLGDSIELLSAVYGKQ